MKFTHCEFEAGISDAEAVTLQVGREPRSPWRVVERCSKGYPQVIASPSRLDDGTPFPTTFWLACPWLTDEVSRLESAGEIARWNERVEQDEDLREDLLDAAEEFKAARTKESAGEDACDGVSVAGQKDPVVTKCLHARVALALVGIADPIGNAVLDTIYGERGRAHRVAHQQRSKDGQA